MWKDVKITQPTRFVVKMLFTFQMLLDWTLLACAVFQMNGESVSVDFFVALVISFPLIHIIYLSSLQLFARFAASRSPIHMYARVVCVRACVCIHKAAVAAAFTRNKWNEMKDTHIDDDSDNDGDDEARETEKTAADLKIKCNRANKDKWKRFRVAIAGALARSHS